MVYNEGDMEKFLMGKTASSAEERFNDLYDLRVLVTGQFIDGSRPGATMDYRILNDYGSTGKEFVPSITHALEEVTVEEARRNPFLQMRDRSGKSKFPTLMLSRGTDQGKLVDIVVSNLVERFGLEGYGVNVFDGDYMHFMSHTLQDEVAGMNYSFFLPSFEEIRRIETEILFGN